LSDKKKRAFYETQINKSKHVLFEGEENEGTMYGFTENYIKVKTDYNPDLVNTIQQVRLIEIDRDSLMKVALE
jgi:threonylcarbamoyladenosine tRNA methylthiotransferase MtaB